MTGHIWRVNAPGNRQVNRAEKGVRASSFKTHPSQCGPEGSRPCEVCCRSLGMGTRLLGFPVHQLEAIRVLRSSWGMPASWQVALAEGNRVCLPTDLAPLDPFTC